MSSADARAAVLVAAARRDLEGVEAALDRSGDEWARLAVLAVLARAAQAADDAAFALLEERAKVIDAREQRGYLYPHRVCLRRQRKEHSWKR